MVKCSSIGRPKHANRDHSRKTTVNTTGRHAAYRTSTICGCPASRNEDRVRPIPRCFHVHLGGDGTRQPRSRARGADLPSERGPIEPQAPPRVSRPRYSADTANALLDMRVRSPSTVGQNAGESLKEQPPAIRQRRRRQCLDTMLMAINFGSLTTPSAVARKGSQPMRLRLATSPSSARRRA